MKFHPLFFVLFSLSHLGILAQSGETFYKVNPFYFTLGLKVEANPFFKLNDSIKFTSLQIELEEPSEGLIKIAYKNHLGSSIQTTLEIYKPLDEFSGASYGSGLYVFESSPVDVMIDFGAYQGKVKINLVYAPKLSDETALRLNKKSARCDKPEMVSYTLWRAGLPDPKPPREATLVEHLVIHHSAGSNTDTNYLNTVRNIYLFHTQSNGWDDIGYNFLIAPNGVIFNGRDPQGVADDDNILGAHFCGKNQNTMGVCMMGNFVNQRPTDEAIFSLKYLLAWKLKKSQINAFGQTIHPQTTGSLLNNVCGHRDGCSTECPGDSLYSLLSSIKTESARIADSCGLILKAYKNLDDFRLQLYPNPCKNKLVLYSEKPLKNYKISIYNLNGSCVFEGIINTNQAMDIGLMNGSYFYKVFNGYHLMIKGIFLVRNE